MLQEQLQDLNLIWGDLAPLGLQHVLAIFQIAPYRVTRAALELGHDETPNI
jgi:hypothetical protein